MGGFNRFLKRTVACLLAGVAIFGFSGCQKDAADIGSVDEFDYTTMNLVGKDALGREVDVVGFPRSEEVYVGIWYSFWEGQHPSLQREILNIQQLLDEGREDVILSTDVGQFFYWGEPLYGYYNMQDPYVLTRHIELFVQAGLDFVCVDCTNQYDYLEVGEKFLTILRDFKNQGFKVPGVCFYTNTNSGTMVEKIYNDYYKSGKWDDLWFRPNGRPIIAGITENNDMASDQTKYHNSKDFVSQKYQNYFEVKESQWPNGEYNDNGMPWMSWEYPQKILGGYVAVPVAQHDHTYACFSTMAPESSRGYNNMTKVREGDYREGLSFQQMWDSVIERKDQISTVFVCCWNEWIAQKHYDYGFFPDAYNWEYSRDVEMMKGGYGDNYYMQLVKNVRDFKYNEALAFDYPQNEIVLGGGEEQWEHTATYKDYAGDAIVRDFPNCVDSFHYVDNSARNDITEIKVTHDENNLYFRIQTKDAVTEYNGADENWMNILISTGEGGESFENYNYLINRCPQNGKTAVEKSKGGYSWQKVGEADYTVEGNVMVVSIPLAALGLRSDNCSFQFKVADHVTEYRDIMDYYVSGDSAPLGRLNFAYGY